MDHDADLSGCTSSTSTSTSTDMLFAVGSVAEEFESQSSENSAGPLSKKPRLRGLSVRGRQRGSSGKFKKSWNIPFLVPSTKGEKFTYCRLCSRDVSVAHGGLNDAKRHC